MARRAHVEEYYVEVTSDTECGDENICPSPMKRQSFPNLLTSGQMAFTSPQTQYYVSDTKTRMYPRSALSTLPSNARSAARPFLKLHSVPRLGLTEVQQTAFHTTFPKVDCTECAKTCMEAIANMKSDKRNILRRKLPYGQRAKIIMNRVYEFFKDLKERLEGTCAYSLLGSPKLLTSLACGVAQSTLTRIVHDTEENLVSASTSRKKTSHSKKSVFATTFRNYGQVWGDVVKEAIHSKLRDDEDITISELHELLQYLHEDFNLSRMTLYRLVKSLGFSFRKNGTQKFIFEKENLIAKRKRYLQSIAASRENNECLIYTDETWVFAGMTKSRGWNDNNIPQFPSRSIISKYSCNKSAGKNKGKRAIVIGAIGEEGVVPGCTKVFVSGKDTSDGDYHRDMDHLVFEEWLKDSLPRMVRYADGRQVNLIMDNAPYHSRRVEKLPTRSSTKAQILEYLIQNGITIKADAKKTELVAELDHFYETRGGRATLLAYAVEGICKDHNVKVTRLPPFHCMFNPIELLWGRLKTHLNKCGKISDKIDVVKSRTVDWMASVPASYTRSWFRKVEALEDEARQKEILDSQEDESEDDEESENDEELFLFTSSEVESSEDLSISDLEEND